MEALVIDIETYWDQEYRMGAGKMCTWEYILDPRFRIHAVGATVLDLTDSSNTFLEPQCIVLRCKDLECIQAGRKDLREWLIGVGYTTHDLVAAHNGAFDFPAIYQYTGLLPKRMMCTMLLAMYRYGQADVGGIYTKYAGSKNSLGHVFESIFYNPDVVFGGKDQTGLINTMGRDPWQFTEQEEYDFLNYLQADVSKCSTILSWFFRGTPVMRRYAINWSLRNMCVPELVFDHAAADAAQKFNREELLARLGCFAGVSEGDLRSKDKFKAVIEAIPGMGPGSWPDVVTDKGNVVPLSSKADPIWAELLSDPGVPQQAKDIMNLKVDVTAASRDKRIDRYAHIAAQLGGKLPIHTVPSGAHTHRPTGGSGSGGNPLNMPQGGVIRKSIKAPDGSCLLVFDFTGIELRICRWSARDELTKKITLEGGDIYTLTASNSLHKPEAEVTKQERFQGKITQLSCQYGTGADTLAAAINVPVATARAFVENFRKVQHPNVVAAWGACDQLLRCWSLCTEETWNPVMAEFFFHYIDMPVKIEFCRIVWPSGTTLFYDNLERSTKTLDSGRVVDQYSYRQRHKLSQPRHIYGALLWENLVQSLANEIMWEKQRSIEMKANMNVQLQVYDEIVCVCPDDLAPTKYREIEAIMTEPVSWWPGQPPLDVDGQVVRVYDHAE